jgi:hypothetical protein
VSWGGVANEATRNYFINEIFQRVLVAVKDGMPEAKQEQLKLENESEVVSEESDYHGPVEFVVMYKQLFLFITEASSPSRISFLCSFTHLC